MGDSVNYEDVEFQVSSRIDLVIVLDGSGSVGASDFEVMKKYTLEFAQELDLNESRFAMGVVQFASTGKIHIEVTWDMNTLSSQIPGIPFDNGGTNFNEGLEKAEEALRSSCRNGISRRIVIFQTDGDDSNSKASETARRMQANGTRIIALGVGSGVKKEGLRPLVGNEADIKMASDYKQIINELRSLIKVFELDKS